MAGARRHGRAGKRDGLFEGAMTELEDRRRTRADELSRAGWNDAQRRVSLKLVHAV